jgi:hypothetical protein
MKTEAQGSELTLAQEASGVFGGDSTAAEALDGQDEVMRNGKLALFGQEEQDQPEFEFRHESPDAFVRPVSVGRLVSNGTPRNLESDAFFELQDSLSVASNSEAEDAGGPGWWKPTSGSVGTPGAEFYDAFEGTNQFIPNAMFICILMWYGLLFRFRLKMATSMCNTFASCLELISVVDNLSVIRHRNSDTKLANKRKSPLRLNIVGLHSYSKSLWS